MQNKYIGASFQKTERRIFMCYKDELQQKNKEKIEHRFAEDNTPQFIQRFFIKFASRSQASALTYYTALKNFFEWCIEKHYIMKENFSDITISPKRKQDDLFTIDAEHIMEYLAERQLSNATLSTRKNILSSFWKYLKRNKSCSVKENIIEEVDFRKEKSNTNLQKKLPTSENIRQMEEAIYSRTRNRLTQLRNLCVLRVLKGTGMRESELAGLDTKHICLEGSAEIPCPYVTILRKGMYNFETEARNVLLSTDAAEAIKQWLTVRDTIPGSTETEALFLTSNGKRLTENNITDIFKTYGNGLTPHKMRHWYATTMLPIYGLAFVVQQCGHVSVETTIGNYANATAGLTEIVVPA